MPNTNVKTNLDYLLSFLDMLQDQAPDNVMTMFFVQKNTTDTYISYMPQISNDLQKKVMEVVLPNLKDSLQRRKAVDYNPIGVADGENERIASTQVNNISIFLESISEENLYTDMSTIKIDKISFYVIRIKWDDDIVYLFRQFTKVSKLRKGLISQIVENELKEMDNNFLGIDGYTDMALYRNDLIVLNHVSLERIFNYRDEFMTITNNALDEIERHGVINNIDQFAEDCKRDIRVLKRFTNIMNSNRLPLFFKYYDKVPKIVKTLGIDLEFDKKGHLIYREKSQLFHIINLMSDSYFRSLLADRIGIAVLEDKI